MSYIKYAELIKTVALKKGEERGCKCGFDLMMGIHKGDLKKRVEAWEGYLESEAWAEEDRDGIWVPAIYI